MRTPLDMATRLKQKSLRSIAAEVALLNHVSLPSPLSLREIMRLFANVAKPEMPTNLINQFQYPVTSPTLSPIFSDFTWIDAGAKTFRYATRYRCRLSVGYDSSYAAIGGDADVWAASTETVFEVPLKFDTDYKASVYAWNDWGQSEWHWLTFHTYDDPNPPSQGPGQSPPPPKAQQPSGIEFWNCDVTSIGPGQVEHLPVYFWLFDLSAGTRWSQLVEPGYNADASCGPGVTNVQVVIPSSSTTSIMKGHEYQWEVVKPSNVGCDNSNDPDSADCVVEWGKFTAGDDAPLVVSWSNT
jgi:hypothetical protein